MIHQVVHFVCSENDRFPNNANLAVCILTQVFEPGQTDLAAIFEQQFQENGWPPAWRNGLYDIHHFHSTAHEALGIYSGWVEVCFGGPGGVIKKASAGDVIIIPAGVSHKNMRHTDNFRVVGSYPIGQHPNMKYGKKEERPQVDKDISLVQLPSSDPVFGPDGPLLELWRKHP